MASLSEEVENYVRMSLLLTGVSPRAVRTLFDQEFHPKSLDSSIKKEYNKLLDLKIKHRINQSQWNLLFPRYPDTPDSKTFDITLMITFLRNLTGITQPPRGYDCLPTDTETTPGADLARIKYYRNFLAHLDDGNIETIVFETAWDDISSAIVRLGGQQMKQECDTLKSKPLDQSNQEIMIEIKRSSDEIMMLKDSFESLKTSHISLQEQHAAEKKSHAEEMEKLRISQQDPVPYTIRDPPACTECVIFGMSSYKIIEVTATWSEAMNNCSCLGGNLAEIETETESNFITNELFTRNSGATGYWLGGYNFNSDSDLEWISKPNERMPYHNFAVGEPNQPTSEKCLMAITNYNFEWVDASCQMTVAYICEF